MRSITVERIETPSYGRPCDVEIEPEAGEASQAAFAPHLSDVLTHVAAMLERELNDPDFVFTDPDAGFPQRSELTGHFYLSSLRYDGDESAHELWILLYCLGRDGRSSEDAEPNFDYLGVEMIVYLDLDSGELSYEEHFNREAL